MQNHDEFTLAAIILLQNYSYYVKLKVVADISAVEYGLILAESLSQLEELGFIILKSLLLLLQHLQLTIISQKWHKKTGH